MPSPAAAATSASTNDSWSAIRAQPSLQRGIGHQQGAKAVDRCDRVEKAGVCHEGPRTISFQPPPRPIELIRKTGIAPALDGLPIMLIMQSQSPLIFADRVRLPVIVRWRSPGRGSGADRRRDLGRSFREAELRRRLERAAASLFGRRDSSDPAGLFEPLGHRLCRIARCSTSAPAIRAAIDWFQCDLQTVRLMRLTPGSIIKEHFDYDLAAEWGAARIHIPITTNPQVEFTGQPRAGRDGAGQRLVSAPVRPAQRGQSRHDRPRFIW